MGALSEISLSSSMQRIIALEPKKWIQCQIYSEKCSPERVVSNVAVLEGSVDIYCWYEGPEFLPKVGACFMKKFIFEPLYKLKQDVKLYLYSLKAWDLEKDVSKMPKSTDLGEAINRINKVAVECIYSYSFFKFCAKAQKESALYKFLNEELPKKKWLFRLSEGRREKRMTVAQLFNNRISLFDCIKDLNVSAAYSLMQYVEGYFLIKNSVEEGLLRIQEAGKKGLSDVRKKIQIAFVLPYGEDEYYLDYRENIEKMLQADFGKRLSGVEINISFHFFEYVGSVGSSSYGGSLNLRPYIDKQKGALRVKAEEIGPYFDYLPRPSFAKEVPPSFYKEEQTGPFLKDVIHNINGWD